MRELYPEPPHLIIAVYSNLKESDCFSAMCMAAEDSGCSPQGIVEVVPWNQSFDLLSDLAKVTTQLKIDIGTFKKIIADDSDFGRPIRASYLHKRFGVVVVEYLWRRTGLEDRHPIAIALSAGPLGIPSNLWTPSDQPIINDLVHWTKNFLRTASSVSKALYGSIDVEGTLPTPSALRQGVPRRPSEIFVSNSLLESDKALVMTLHEGSPSLGEAWENGYFFSSWEPYSSRN